MDFLKQWTLCVCTALVASVIFSLFTPKGKMKRFYKILISVFIFISFLYPLKDFHNFHFEKYAKDSDAYLQEQGNEGYENALNVQIKSLLENRGIIGALVSCKAEVDYRSNEIEIKEVRIAVSDEYDLTEVQKIVYEELGIKAEVIHIGD